MLGHLDVARIRAVESQLEIRIGQRLRSDAAILVVEWSRMRWLLPTLTEQQRRHHRFVLQETRIWWGRLCERITRAACESGDRDSDGPDAAAEILPASDERRDHRRLQRMVSATSEARA